MFQRRGGFHDNEEIHNDSRCNNNKRFRTGVTAGTR